jgi:hypothetical protein
MCVCARVILYYTYSIHLEMETLIFYDLQIPSLNGSRSSMTSYNWNR